MIVTLATVPTEETLRGLPNIESLRQKTQALAAVDAIMSPDWKYRYFLFNAAWDTGEMMATIRNGSGDEVFLLFTRSGAILKGFDHESCMSPWAREKKALWTGMFTSVPDEFRHFLTEPAFDIDNSTFCAWRRSSDSSWHSDEIDYPDADGNEDGSDWLLQEYIEGPSRYVDFCKDYYEREVPLVTVQAFYDFKQLDQGMLEALNPGLHLDEMRAEMLEIGYPV
jgi:hypothetical protein